MQKRPLASLTAGLAPAQNTPPPVSPRPDLWGGYIQKILTEDKPTFRAVNPTTWIKTTDYPELEFRPSLHAFTAQRAELLAMLGPLPPEAWNGRKE